SISCGFKYVRATHAALRLNASLIDVYLNQHELAGDNPQKKEIANDAIKGLLEKESERGGINSKWQYLWFIIGGVFYLVGHIIIMHQNGVC
ncbi:hypothetical protein LCGC14_1817210, partial [marine sediment metagenome]